MGSRAARIAQFHVVKVFALESCKPSVEERRPGHRPLGVPLKQRQDRGMPPQPKRHRRARYERGTVR